MRVEGHCYCGRVRYEADSEPMMQAQCYCRECQYVTGGAPNNFLAMPADSFRFTSGTPKAFARSDIPNPVAREFCPDCGTQLITRPKRWPAVIIKVGTLDDPSVFKPNIAIYTIDKQPYQNVPEGLTQFERMPPA